MADRPFSAAAERNGAAILDVLQLELEDRSIILEIGSGTGQHAVRFAAAMPQLRWQTSDVQGNRAGIEAWVADSGLDNLLSPIEFDVQTSTLPKGSYDAVYSANTAHIMSFPAVVSMFETVGKVLLDGGVFCLYGPFRQSGTFNTRSNAEFHESLRCRDPEMGIRHLEELDALASGSSMQRHRLYAMPANNHLAVWRKDAS